MITLAAGSSNVLVPDTKELIVGILSFFILFGVLAWRAFPQIQRTYAERTDRIEGGIKRAEQAQAEAKRTLEQYRAQLAEARTDANRIREEARASAQRIGEEVRAKAQQDAAQIAARAEQRIETDRTQAFAELRAEIGRLAVELSGRILGESLRDDDLQRRVVDRFLSDLEGEDRAGGSDGGSAREPEQVS